VVGGYAGSALMRDLDLATRLIEAVAVAVAVPFMVKMRLGWDEANLNAAELATRAEALGAAAVTVHGRTRQQFYKGRADWLAIAPAVAAVSIPVLANGDVGSVVEARQCLTLSGASAVMIGRASLGRPWLVGQIGQELEGRTWREPDADQKLALVLEHYEGLLGSLGRDIGLRHARKHLAAYVEEAARAGHVVRPADRAELLTSDRPEIVAALLRRVFEAPLREAA
jgi:nifR3 family TIM-barrel protein